MENIRSGIIRLTLSLALMAGYQQARGQRNHDQFRAVQPSGWSG
jgi:hypothetical protein